MLRGGAGDAAGGAIHVGKIVFGIGHTWVGGDVRFPQTLASSSISLHAKNPCIKTVERAAK